MNKFGLSNGGGMSDIDLFKKNIEAIDFNKLNEEDDA